MTNLVVQFTLTTSLVVGGNTTIIRDVKGMVRSLLWCLKFFRQQTLKGTVMENSQNLFPHMRLGRTLSTNCPPTNPTSFI